MIAKITDIGMEAQKDRFMVSPGNDAWPSAALGSAARESKKAPASPLRHTPPERPCDDQARTSHAGPDRNYEAHYRLKQAFRRFLRGAGHSHAPAVRPWCGMTSLV